MLDVACDQVQVEYLQFVENQEAAGTSSKTTSSSNQVWAGVEWVVGCGFLLIRDS